VKGYAGHPNSPGFFCCSEEKQSGIYSSLAEVINTCYKEVFRSNTKFSSPLVIGFDNSDVVEQLFSDIIFRSYTFSLGRLNIFVLEMGKSKKPDASNPNKVWLDIDRFSNYTGK
ncbi:19651_t:CDS:2, partial [Funneliformis geosporum]